MTSVAYPWGGTYDYVYDKYGNVLPDIGSLGSDGIADLEMRVEYRYDSEGNLLTETDGSDKWTYTYDKSGNMLSVMRNKSLRSFGGKDVYTYDGKGNILTYVNGHVSCSYTYVSDKDFDADDGYVPDIDYGVKDTAE